MNIYDASLFTAPDCLPCCTPAPADCSCALLIPPQASPYVDYATADGVIADPLLVADCLAYNDVSLDMTSFSAAFDGTTFTADGAWSSAVSSFGYVWISISAKSGATLTFDSTAGSSFDGVIYTCDGTEVEVIGPAATPITSAALPADGEYYLKMLPNDPPMGSGPFTACTITVTSSDDFWVNPVIALWDDSGTTRQLEACPRLYLPPLTESTGDWYVDCAEAADVITDFTSNCTGYFEPDSGVDSFSVGGGTLNFVLGASGTASTTGPMWGSFTADAGDIISVAQNGDPGDITAILYDYTGTLVEDFSGSVTSGVSSAALPYTGRYIIMVNVVFPPPSAPFTSLNVDVTSDGAFDVHTIQALYDSSLTCPSRLNCGDSC